MDLATYIEDMDRRRELAAATGTSQAYLWQVATGWKGRRPGIDLVKKIEAATEGKVTRQDMRPDVYGPPEALDSAA